MQGAFPKMDQKIATLNTTIGYKANQSVVDEKFSMRTPKVTKKFRFLYNKGVHDDGTIASFYN